MISIETQEFNKLQENCSFKITRIGQEFCSPQKKPEKSNRVYYSLHFVLFGSGTLRDGDNIYKVNAKSAFLLYGDREYEYYPDPKNPWTYIWVDMWGDNLDLMFSKVGFDRSDPVIKINKMNEFNPILRDMCDAFSYNLYGEMAYYGYFFLIFDRLIDNSVCSSVSKAKILNKKLIRNILIYMNNNYASNITPKDICNKNNISYGTLMGLFKSEVGMAPMEYLAKFRISFACVLLKSGEQLSIGEVANKVGYTDQLYFSRVFKRVKGMSPTDYIKSETTDDPYEWLIESNIDFR